MNRGCAATSRTTSAADAIEQGRILVVFLRVCTAKYEVLAAKLLWKTSM